MKFFTKCFLQGAIVKISLSVTYLAKLIDSLIGQLYATEIEVGESGEKMVVEPLAY